MKQCYNEIFCEAHGIKGRIGDHKELSKRFINYIEENFNYFLPASETGNWGGWAFVDLYGDNRHESIIWLENNCIGDWALMHYGFYFTDKNDMLKFKLVWFGKVQ